MSKTPGPVEPPVALAPRHGLQGSELINRIEVAEQHDRCSPLGAGKIDLQVIAGMGLRMQCHCAAQRRKLGGKIHAKLIAGQLFMGRRFPQHDLSQGGNHRLAALLEPGFDFANARLQLVYPCLSTAQKLRRRRECRADECIIWALPAIMETTVHSAPADAGNLTLSIGDLLELLPHRYPMLLIDRVVEMVRAKRIVAIKNVTINEPFFVGHFPGYPIMPGVLIVEAMAQAGAALLFTEIQDRKDKLLVFTGIERARFRRPVTPGDQLRIEVDVLVFRGTAGRLQGKAYVDGKLVCEGIVTCRLLPRPRGKNGGAEAAGGGSEAPE